MKKCVKNEQRCSLFGSAFEILGKKWTGLIIHVLSNGPKRFADLSGAISGMSDRMLIERLKELESFGIVSRNVFNEIPVKIVYELTPKGEALTPVFVELLKWSNEWCREGEDSC